MRNLIQNKNLVMPKSVHQERKLRLWAKPSKIKKTYFFMTTKSICEDHKLRLRANPSRTKHTSVSTCISTKSNYFYHIKPFICTFCAFYLGIMHSSYYDLASLLIHNFSMHLMILATEISVSELQQIPKQHALSVQEDFYKFHHNAYMWMLRPVPD